MEWVWGCTWGECRCRAALDLTQGPSLSLESALSMPSAPVKKGSEGWGEWEVLVTGQIGASPALWLRDLLGSYPTNAALRIVRAFYSSATNQLRAPDQVTFSSGSQFPHLYNEGIGINSLKGPFQSCVRGSDSNCIKLSTYGCWTVSCIRMRWQETHMTQFLPLLMESGFIALCIAFLQEHITFVSEKRQRKGKKQTK